MNRPFERALHRDVAAPRRGFVPSLVPSPRRVPPPVRMLVVDQEQIVREGVRAMLDHSSSVSVVGDADGHDAALEAADALLPDVVLLGLPFPDDGLALCAALVGRWPRPGLLVMSTDAPEMAVLAAWRAGARGYVLRGIGQTQLVSAIQAVAAGEPVLDPVLGGRLLARLISGSVRTGTVELDDDAGVRVPASSGAPKPLTNREREVLVQISRGLSNSLIARELFISEETVRSHIKAILRKLHATHRSQAVAIAVRAGLCD